MALQSFTKFFFTFSILAIQGAPYRPKVTTLGIDVPQGPAYWSAKFVAFWQPVYEISAGEIRWFRWKRHRQTDKKQ